MRDREKTAPRIVSFGPTAMGTEFGRKGKKGLLDMVAEMKIHGLHVDR